MSTVHELRTLAEHLESLDSASGEAMLMREAAAEIEKLKESLQPFAGVEPGYLRIPPEWFERARAALACD